jgi:uncharacterized protein
MQQFPFIEQNFLLKGPAGNIEIIATPRKIESKKMRTVIICHPHPLYGGTMNNKVVTTIAKTLQEMGLHTIRFNFRGVGKSEGAHDNGVGETEDVIAIAQWVKKICPEDTLWLAGFSFGGYVAARAATMLHPEQLITVAPQVSRFADLPIPDIHAPWLIIQGEKDEIISPESVYAWVETVKPSPTLVRLPNAGHFFHGQLGELREALRGNLNQVNKMF